MSNILKTLVHVKPKSQEGKDRIKKHGELYRITGWKTTVTFCNKPGPWIHLESLYDTRQGWWINESNDDDFNIVERITAA